ncbi:MAG: Rieske 2Fe-2S domain-containing protein [Ilumatobacteraceae bacterium]
MSDLRELNWYPLVNSRDLPYRHPYRSKLLGHELVIWRADDGFVNVWLDRCLHRGMRLSRGLINGNEIKCQYHGWHYSNRSGGCTYIPAHPIDSPAQTLSCETFKSIEKYGLVWSGISPRGLVPDLSIESGESIVNLRSMFMRAPASDTTSALMEYEFSPKLTFFVQPLDELTSIVHGLVDNSQNSGDVEDILHYHNDQLVKIRTKVEFSALARPVRVNGLANTKTSDPTTKPASPQFSQSSRLKVKVSRKWITATDIVGVELSPIDFESLPTFLPGAHIDLVLPNGLARQYSLTNGPGELGTYRIGIKREPQSSGGSLFIHDVLDEGDVVEISMPRNNFPLRQDSSRTILIAGGIGVTPLLAMSQVLAKQNLHYELHYFAQSHEHLAFGEITATLENNFISHLGLSPMETMQTIRSVLGAHNTSENVYICGPKPMLDGARDIAQSLEWPDNSVHFEYFKNSNVIHSDSSFIVDLARSALSLTVESGQTILQTLRNNGVAVPSSCEQGACGTCLVRVLEGTPDHQDVYLNESERQRGDQILTCVSRALSEKLTLDI